MTSTANDNQVCVLCNKPHPWPDGSTPKHPFTPEGSDPAGFLGKRDKDRQRGSDTPSPTLAVAGWPFDPVLRQALIDKGLLTADDLRVAEAKIRDMSVVFNQERRS